MTRALLALVLVACSTTPTRAPGTAALGSDIPITPGSVNASATAVETSTGLRFFVANVFVPNDACEPARIFAANGPDEAVGVFVMTVDLPGPGSFENATDTSATVHVTGAECASQLDESATSLDIELTRDGDDFSGSIHAKFPSGNVFAVLRAPDCGAAIAPADATFCASYGACVDGGVEPCLTSP